VFLFRRLEGFGPGKRSRSIGQPHLLKKVILVATIVEFCHSQCVILFRLKAANIQLAPFVETASMGNADSGVWTFDTGVMPMVTR
jgi:hypothetical protein